MAHWEEHQELFRDPSGGLKLVAKYNEIRYFSDLSQKEQDHFRAKAMVYFPEIFGASASKFVPLVRYLLEDFDVITPSIRDIFSARGKLDVKFDNGQTFKVRAVDAKLHNLAKVIDQILATASERELKEAWKVSRIDQDRCAQFAKVLNSCSEQVPNSILVGDAFLSGL